MAEEGSNHPSQMLQCTGFDQHLQREIMNGVKDFNPNYCQTVERFQNHSLHVGRQVCSFDF